MKLPILLALCLGTSLAQKHSGALHDPNPDLPNATERDAIAREDYRKNTADAAALLQLAVQLKTDIENQSAGTISATTGQKAEKIEKLAHGIQGRLKH